VDIFAPFGNGIERMFEAKDLGSVTSKPAPFKHLGDSGTPRVSIVLGSSGGSALKAALPAVVRESTKGRS
jgi:hypothetical protein